MTIISNYFLLNILKWLKKQKIYFEYIESLGQNTTAITTFTIEGNVFTGQVEYYEDGGLTSTQTLTFMKSNVDVNSLTICN